VTPGSHLPAPPTIVTSPDSLLTATLDASHAGAQLFFTGGHPQEVTATNYYPDPSHEFGLAPLASSASTGAGTLSLDTSRKHSGLQSVKFLNQNADVAAATNLIPDPSFKYGVAGWTTNAGSTVAQDTTRARTGTYSMLVNSGTVGSGGFDAQLTVPVVNGNTYTFSAWIYNPSTGGSSTGGTVMRTSGALTVMTANLPTTKDAWFQLSITTTATSTGNAQVQFYLPNAANQQLWFDDLGLVEGSTAVDFSGDTAATANASYSWSGTPGASSSVRTPLYPTVNRSATSITTPATMGLAVGDSITASGWVYIPSTVTNLPGTIFRLGGSGMNAVNASVPAERDQWVKVSVTATVATTSGTVQTIIYTGARNGDALWFDDFSLMPGTSTIDFNGDSAVDGDYHYRWTGTAGSSSSEQYLPGSAISGVSEVRFYRQDNTPVRSGSPSPAVGNQALAYDNEAPLGVDSWFAVAYDSDGEIVVTTDYVTLTVPAQVNTSDVWLKSVSDPTLDVLAKAVNEVPAMTYSARQSFSDVIGSPFPVGSFDVWSAGDTEWTFLVNSTEERQKLIKCLQSGVILVQPHPTEDFEPMYVLAGDITRTYVGSNVQKAQTVEVSFTQVERPSAENAALAIPGRSWQTVKEQYADWQAVNDSYPSWITEAGLPITE
jgi:hypothetical protein